MEDRKWASERLAERGWGRPKQEVLVDDCEIRGVTIIHRRWARVSTLWPTRNRS